MKKFYLLFLFTILLLNLYCQEYEFLFDTVYHYTWYSAVNDWLCQDFDVYMYDTAGNHTETINCYWSSDSEDCVNQYHYVYSYDSAGNQTEYYKYNWDSYHDDWVNDYHYVYSYDSAGNQSKHYRYNWDSYYNDWVNDYHYVYSYDTAGNQTGNFKYRWDSYSSEWVNDYHTVYTFDSAGNKTESWMYYWSSGINDWVNSYHCVYSYDANGNQTEYITHWDSYYDDWVNLHYYVYSYDTFGNQTGYYPYDWNSGINDWEIFYYFVYSSDAFGNQTEYYRYDWDWRINDWVNSDHYVYIYKPLEGKHLGINPGCINFGKKKTGETVSLIKVALSNIGSDTVTVSNISAPDSIFSLFNVPSFPVVIYPGHYETFDVSFLPVNTITYADSIIVLCDDQDEPEKIISLTGEGIIIMPADSGMCYAVTDQFDGGRLLTLDPASGKGTLIGPTGLSEMLGIAIDTSGMIYGTDGKKGNIYRIDAATGTAIWISNTGLTNMTAMAFDSANKLYGIYEDQLLIIDPETGFSKPVGNTGIRPRGLAFDPTGGILWGITYSGYLYKINTETAAVTSVGYAGDLGGTPDIHFDITGNLFAVSGGYGWIDNLMIINKNTGEGTLIGETGFHRVSGLALYNVPVEGKHIRIIPDSLDFGIVGVDDFSDSRLITVSNVGSEDLTFDNISTHGTAFKITTDVSFPVIISPAGSVTFDIIFSPGDSLNYTDTIQILSDDQDEPVKNILVTGKGMLIMPADSGMCYASTGATDGGRLLTIDPATGQGTLIGPTGLYEVSSIAINSSGKIYGIYNGDLYRIDVATGKSLFVASTNMYGIDAMAFDSNDVLYGVRSSYLYTINPVSGESKQICYTRSLTGIAFDPTNGTLWGITYSGELYKINTETGSSTFIGSTGISGTTTDLHFDIAGNLFAVTGGYYNTNILISINKSTGKSVIIGEIGFRNVTGIAFYNVPIEGKHIRVTPDSVDFGIVGVDYSSDSRLIAISNVGSEDLTVESIATSGSAFEIITDRLFPVIISPAGSETFEFTFSPTDSLSYTDTIRIFSSDQDEPIKKILVTGKGIIIMPADSGMCYAITKQFDGGGLLTLDPSSGEGTLIGTAGQNEITEIAIDTSGMIYGTDGKKGNIYRVDAATGTAIWILNSGLKNMTALAFDSANKLYGIYENQLMIIDLESGFSKPVGNTGTGFIGLAFDPTNGILWGINSFGSIYLINTETGLSTSIGNSGISGTINDFHFDVAGNLFAVTGVYYEVDKLISINKNTGEGTMIGEIGFNQVRGLVFYNVPIKGKHIRVIPDSLDFGIVGVGDSSDSRTVTISNIGNDKLTLNNISTHNSAFKITTDLLFPVIINPAGSETFEIIFSPVDSLSYSDTIHISSDDPDEPVKKILVTGKGMLIMPADSGMCYASTGATDGSRLLIIDPVTGQGTPIGPTGLFEVSSIAINSSGEIYGTYSGDLYRIDAATGKTLFHVSTDLYRIDALAFDSNNVLYAISSSSSLITINTVSGEFNQIGYISSLTGITFDPTNDSLWGISSSGRIYQISTETGSSTFIGSTGISGTTADLHFDIAGNLFAVTGGYYDTYKFISINKSTGKGIIIGEIGFRNVTGMAFYNVPIEGKHIRVIPDSIDFGIVEIGYSSDSRLITISNIGSENLTLDSISIPDESMNITGLPPFPAVIKPGTSLLLAVNFMPRDCDLEAASLVIFSDDNEGMARIITLVGKGISDNCPIVVNSTGDTDDINPGDGLCEDSNGNCTFRAAILEANNRPGKDTIKFNIPGLGPHTIQPDCGLPEITDSIVIEGTTEPDFTGIPIIELNGSNAGNEVSGLVITSGYSTIRGLVINRFNGNGIHIFEGGNNKIEGNYIGTDISGTIPLGNESGVFIENASNNTIGGLNSTSANIIACNRDKAIVIVSGTRNAILSNSIYNNAGGGIDLLDDGITVNDNVDIDIGPNNLQNFPEIISTGIIDNGNLVVKYAIDSDPVNSTYPLTIQFFRSDEERQGKVLLGTDTFTVGDLDSIMVTADLGNAEVLGMDEGEKISATATDGENNTSEFSEDQTIGRFVHIDPLESNVARIVNYPNPFTYRTTIQFPNSQRQNYTLIVTDLTGKRVRIINNITEDTFVFKREDLPGGLYLLELRGPKIFRGKIMIE